MECPSNCAYADASWPPVSITNDFDDLGFSPDEIRHLEAELRVPSSTARAPTATVSLLPFHTVSREVHQESHRLVAASQRQLDSFSAFELPCSNLGSVQSSYVPSICLSEPAACSPYSPMDHSRLAAVGTGHPMDPSNQQTHMLKAPVSPAAAAWQEWQQELPFQTSPAEPVQAMRPALMGSGVQLCAGDDCDRVHSGGLCWSAQVQAAQQLLPQPGPAQTLQPPPQKLLPTFHEPQFRSVRSIRPLRQQASPRVHFTERRAATGMPWPWSRRSLLRPAQQAPQASMRPHSYGHQVCFPVPTLASAEPYGYDLSLDEQLLAEIEAAPWPDFLTRTSSAPAANNLQHLDSRRLAAAAEPCAPRGSCPLLQHDLLHPGVCPPTAPAEHGRACVLGQAAVCDCDYHPTTFAAADRASGNGLAPRGSAVAPAAAGPIAASLNTVIALAGPPPPPPPVSGPDTPGLAALLPAAQPAATDGFAPQAAGRGTVKEAAAVGEATAQASHCLAPPATGTMSAADIDVDEAASGEPLSLPPPPPPKQSSSARSLPGKGDAAARTRPEAAGSGGRSRAAGPSLEVLREMFELPSHQVSSILGISATDFKRKCRALGILRWPQRKISSLRRLEEAVASDPDLTAEERQLVLDCVRHNREAISKDPNVGVDPTLKVVRQSQYKRFFVERVVGKKG